MAGALGGESEDIDCHLHCATDLLAKLEFSSPKCLLAYQGPVAQWLRTWALKPDCFQILQAGKPSSYYSASVSGFGFLFCKHFTNVSYYCEDEEMPQSPPRPYLKGWRGSRSGPGGKEDLGIGGM